MDTIIPAVTPLRQRMLEDMRIRKLDPRTQVAYIRAVRKLRRLPAPLAGHGQRGRPAQIPTPFGGLGHFAHDAERHADRPAFLLRRHAAARGPDGPHASGQAAVTCPVSPRH